MRKFAFLLIVILVITILFLTAAYFVNNQNGKGALQVTSQPSSQVFLEGKAIGKTPLCLCDLPNLLKSGEYSIKLVRDNKDLSPFEQKITIYQEVLTVVDRNFEFQAGASSGSVITFSPIDDKTAQLMVISSPQGSRVILDSSEVGLTPLLLKDITASDHEVKILKEGYSEKTIKIKTVVGKRLEANVILGIKKDASLNTSSSSAQIVIILDTPTGYLRVRESNAVDSRQIATVSPGDKLNLLEEKDGWFKVELEDGKIGWVSAAYATKQVKD